METCAETAKKVRAALRSLFPGKQPSVRTMHSTTIRIEWFDGPTELEVQVVTNPFQSMYRVQNGGDMISVPVGNESGASYISTERHLTKEFLAVIAEKFQVKYSYEVIPEIKEYKDGEAYFSGPTDQFDYHSVANRLMRLARDTNEKNIPLLFSEVEEVFSTSSRVASPFKESQVQSEEESSEPESVQVPDSEEQEVLNQVYSVLEDAISHSAEELEETLLGNGKDAAWTEEQLKNLKDLSSRLWPEAIPVSDTQEEILEPVDEDEQYKAHEADPRSSVEASTFYRFDPVSRIHWLEFEGRPDQEVIDILKREGWKWGGYRKQWFNRYRWTQVPEGIDYFNDGECDYSSERAERLEARAEKHSHAGQSHYKRAHQIMDYIPAGQPILVGHHSEKRHRRDLDRVDTGMHNWLVESDKADKLDAQAEGSERHQKYLERRDVTARRIERLETELRAFMRDKWEPQAEWQRRVDIVKKELAENRAKLEAAGGLPTDTVQVHKNDIILISGSLAQVMTEPRRGGKTYNVKIVEGGARGMQFPHSRTEFQKVVKRADEECPLRYEN